MSWLMCRVSKDARIADSAAYCLCAATPLPFGYLHFADIVDAALLTTLSPYLCTYRCHSRLPIWGCSCIMSFGTLLAHFCLGSMVGDHHACSPAHWLNPSGSFSCISYRYCAVSACKLLLFHFLFCLGLYLFILREVTKRVPFLISALRGLPTALDNDFSMNLPFSLPTGLCLQQ